ncbi:hypothetical protein ACFFV7_45830 [Nonomuraea spiralis]|uniref:Uncharacterized protein n=1 Tax=Nonomuraea spiralis TaxID=46182 RepID=A0ABV5IVN1_9ACTN|nr:hypothetical protein [Nonomuraea spiralis]GGS83538.1 hypothetical protein GCM10010176_028870 [Nonomuraea spiralis]
MTNIGDATTAHLGDARVQDAFATVKKCVTLFGVVGAVVLGVVAVMAFTGQEASAFMWIRGAVLLAVAPLLHRMTVRASEGSYKAFDRVRTLSTILPIAIIGVDLIPGLCPAWYAVLQGLSALALAGVAFITRGAALRAAFPGQK